MNHEQWKSWRCRFDGDCFRCMKKECLDDPEYEGEE